MVGPMTFLTVAVEAVLRQRVRHFLRAELLVQFDYHPLPLTLLGAPHPQSGVRWQALPPSRGRECPTQYAAPPRLRIV
jgi:hypothetical protein